MDESGSDGNEYYEYIENEDNRRASQKEVHTERVAPNMAPSHPVRVLRNAPGAAVVNEITANKELEKLREKVRLYSHSIALLVGFIAGLVIGVLL